MRLITLLMLLFVSIASFCQVTDDFSDGDFTSGTVWSGNSNFGVSNPFEVSETDNQLRSSNLNMGAGTRLAYLSTPDVLDLSSSFTEWTFRFRLGFSRPGATASTNANNTSRVYLLSNSSDLNNDLNGYYVELRYPIDDINEVRFHRQDANSTTELILSGSIQSLASQEFVDVKVTRSELGLWELTANSISQGTVTDNTYSSSTHFGVQIRYTADSRDNGFYFDDFETFITLVADTTPPTISSVEALSDVAIQLIFSENIDEILAEDIENYAINNGISIINATLDDATLNTVMLTTESLTNGQTYTLTVNNIEDLSGNIIANDSEESFQYFVFEEAEAFDVVINEFLADPTPATIFPEGDFIEIFNRSDKFIRLEGWTITDNSGTSNPIENTFIEPNQYIILTSTSVASGYEAFGQVVPVDNFPNLNATGGDEILLADANGSTIAQLTYTTTLVEDAISAELINPDDPCISEMSYRLSEAEDGATPGSQNSVFDSMLDTQNPVISSLGFGSSLVLHFSEKMDAATLTSIGNYTSSNLTINQAEVAEAFPLNVEITFVEEVIPGVNYDLLVSGLLDCTGNQLADTTLTFGVGRAPLFNELLITEIFYDPDPAFGLPEREFIEIYNSSNEIISTEGVFLTDATSSTVLPIFNLNPGTYYVLSSTAGASEFSLNAVGVSGFPTLNNSGELLTLSGGGGLLFSIDYEPDWQEEEKADGGFSLEMVDVTNPCLESPANWKSSINENGGTPGEQNSIAEVIPDNFGPEILTVIAIASDTIGISFSENIDPGAALLAQVSLEPTRSIASYHVDIRLPKTLFIALSEELEENIPYTLSVSDVFDCAGNEVDTEAVTFALPVLAEPNEIKLSEVLFNPRPNGVDFVEVYNDSESYLSLKGWQLARITDEEVSDERLITNEELVINPGAYLVFTIDSDILFSNYPKGRLAQFFQVASLPGYNDDEGTVVLLNDQDEVVAQFSYNEDQHYDLLEDNEGVSLERISFAEPASNVSNWRSASSTEGFATPGYANSQAFSIPTQAAEVVIDPKVFIPGNSGSGRDFTTINYQFQSSGQFANVNIYDQNGRLVRNLAQGELLSTSGFLRWDGETNGGSMARMGYYVVLFEVYDVNGNTEIIKETVVVGRDF